MWLEKIGIRFGRFQLLDEHGGKFVVCRSVHVFCAHRAAANAPETGNTPIRVDGSVICIHGLHRTLLMQLFQTGSYKALHKNRSLQAVLHGCPAL